MLVKPCTTTTALDQMPALLSGRQAGLKELVLVNLGLDVGDLGIEHRVEQEGVGLDVAVHDVAVPDVADHVHLRRELALQLLVQIPCSTRLIVGEHVQHGGLVEVQGPESGELPGLFNPREPPLPPLDVADDDQ